MHSLVLLSGGLDSATALAQAVHRDGPDAVCALAIAYGQRHRRELDAARDIAASYGITLHTLDLTEIFSKSSCSLLETGASPLPQGAYARQRENRQQPLSTYVPFRNGLFLSAAASFALSIPCDTLIYGAHADDAGAAYPDCTPEFVRAMGEAIHIGSGGALRLDAPFIHLRKADIVALGMALGVPFAQTWSCYAGGNTPCGVCGTCIDRAQAFAENGIADPLIETK